MQTQMPYTDFVARLASGHKFDEEKHNVPAEALVDFGLAEVVAAGKDLDGAKKKLFYGKPHAYWDELSDHFRAHPPYSYDVVDTDVLHGVIGVCTEAAELAELLQHALEERRPIDREKVILEAGDVCWYLQLLANALGVTLAEFIQQNVAKLTARYGNAFTPEKALARADEL